MNTEIINAGRDISGGYKVNMSRGENVDRVSSEWFSRPDDERYLSLDDLFASVKGRAERSRTRKVESAAIRVEAHRDNPEKLGLVLPDADEPVAPTHWSFGQLSSLVGAPAAYLRQLPAPLAGINLQYGLTNHRAEQIKTMEVANGRTELRAVTGPDYGRIYDHELVSAVQRIAGNGTGDTRWKVPGVLDWSTGIYNPRVDVTKETTTLYASDRDVFLFLVDDLNPIEAGLLPDGSPDLYFRGFYCWNSEVGAKTLGIASFYLRAVCQNRNLWGVEDFQEIKIRHSKYAASRFAHETAPALSRFAESSPAPFIDGTRGGDPEADTPEARVIAANAAARVEPRQQGYYNAMQVFPWSEGALYQIYAAPGQITNIALEPGERLTGPGPIAAGDTARWIIGDTTSGSGRTERVHILIKPTRPDITTNLVVNTDRRSYHIELHADEETWMPSVAWAYPEVRATPRTPTIRRPAIPHETDRHYRYGLQGDTPPSRPISVFDDGLRVYVVFPPGVAQGEMPPLFVIGADGRGQIVNTRVLGNVLIVDRLFGAAELRLGERQQQVVRILRTDGDQRPPRAPQPEAER